MRVPHVPHLVHMARATLLVLLLMAFVAPALAAVEQLTGAQAAQRLASGGWLLMMRHAATEPGVGDPADFRLGNCATQRNLSARGREQARRAGEAMRSLGVRIDEVRTSQWCRCRDTATLAFGGATDWPALNSFFAGRGKEAAQTAQIEAFARELGRQRNVLLVTHQVNISAAMGGSPAPGEIVAGRWQDGRLVPAFRFQPADNNQ
jgi:phosphohistidine phosphatase SixA